MIECFDFLQGTEFATACYYPGQQLRGEQGCLDHAVWFKSTLNHSSHAVRKYRTREVTLVVEKVSTICHIVKTNVHFSCLSFFLEIWWLNVEVIYVHHLVIFSEGFNKFFSCVQELFSRVLTVLKCLSLLLLHCAVLIIYASEVERQIFHIIYIRHTDCFCHVC